MNMNKKTLYWAIGVVVVLLIIFLFWGMAGNGKAGSGTQPSGPAGGSQAESGMGSDMESGAGSGMGSSTESGMENSTDIHAGMGHGTTGTEGTGNADSEYTRYLDEQTAIMDRMMRDMELTEETGNSAIDFLVGMVPHHEAAVEMAQSYLNHGGVQEQLKPLAEDIIVTQKAEIAQMKDMQKSISESGKKDQAKADAYREEYQKMMTGHHGHGAAATGATIDTAFAEGMMMHHQMAVDMAKAILDNTDEEDVLELARQIIKTQESEITLMQKVLQDS